MTVIGQPEQKTPQQLNTNLPDLLSMPLYSTNLVGLSAVFYSSHYIHNLNRVRVVHHVHDLIRVERSICLIGSVVQFFASDFVGSIFYSLLFLFNPRSLELFGVVLS